MGAEFEVSVAEVGVNVAGLIPGGGEGIGHDALKESYLAKNYLAASALKVTDNAVQVLGGHGYVRDHPVEMWLRNARGLAALDGIATV